jgi:hypothetical protein
MTRLCLVALPCLIVASTSSGQITLTFETDDSGQVLVNGQDLSTPPEFGEVISIGTFAGEGHLGPAVFDSNPDGPNADGPDPDLLVDTGNILILQAAMEPFGDQTIDGIFDTPNDTASGGALIINFLADGGLRPLSIDVIDMDKRNSMSLTLIDVGGHQRIIDVPRDYTGDITEGGVGIATVSFDVEPSASLSSITGEGFDLNHVEQLVIEFHESGAVDNLVLSETQCKANAACDDGAYCNGFESCVEGTCIPGSGSPCGTDEVCDETIDDCVPDSCACAGDDVSLPCVDDSIGRIVNYTVPTPNAGCVLPCAAERSRGDRRTAGLAGDQTVVIDPAAACAGGSDAREVCTTLAGDSASNVDVFLLLDDTVSFAPDLPQAVALFNAIVTDLRAAMPDVDFAFGVGRFEDYGGPGEDFGGNNVAGRPFILNQALIRAARDDSGGTEFIDAIASALGNGAPASGGDAVESAVGEGLYQVATGAGFDGDGDGHSNGSGPAGALQTQVDRGPSGDVPAFSTYVGIRDGSLGGVGWRLGAEHIVLLATDVCTIAAYPADAEIPATVNGAAGIEPSSALACSSVPGNLRYGFVGNALSQAANSISDAVAPSGAATIPESLAALAALNIKVIGMGPDVAPTDNAGPAITPDVTLSALARLTGAVDDEGQPLVVDLAAESNVLVGAVVQAVALTAGPPLDVVLTSDPAIGGLVVTADPRSVEGARPGDTVCFDVTLAADGPFSGGQLSLRFRNQSTQEILETVGVELGCGNCTVSCTPPPGSFFEIGSHAITCSTSLGHSCEFGLNIESSPCGPCATSGDCVNDDPCSVGVCDDGVCTYEPGAEESPCDDGNACTVEDVCVAGVCAGVLQPDCAPCETVDDCDPSCLDDVACDAGVCLGTPAEPGTDCDDGDPCTIEDACDGSGCVGTPLDPCVPCETVEDCTGSSFCEGRESCVDSVCVPLTDGPCEEGEVCIEMDDRCRPACECGTGDITVPCSTSSGTPLVYARPQQDGCSVICDQDGVEAIGDTACVLECYPAPGHVFPIGTTEVVCFTVPVVLAATGGSFSACVFDVTVSAGCTGGGQSGQPHGEPDRDGDGVPDDDDNCPDVANGQAQAGQVGIGNQVDSDDDGLGDACDGCPDDAANDADGDGRCASEDACPQDALKFDPGMCGCGNPDTDRDNDSHADCVDGCPDDRGKIAPGVCGCGTSDLDRDSDNIPDCNDLCPLDADNDEDGDRVCGNFDNCRTVPNPGQADSDGDGRGDACASLDPQARPPLPTDPQPQPEPGCGCGATGPASAAMLLAGLCALRLRPRRRAYG